MSRARIDTARPVFIGEYREPKILPRTGFERDPKLIAEYEPYHEHVWPEIIESIEASGIEDMEIYRLGTRMFMVMEVNHQLPFAAQALAQQSNPKVAEWEALLSRFQQPLPQAKGGEKWLAMTRIFKL